MWCQVCSQPACSATLFLLGRHSGTAATKQWKKQQLNISNYLAIHYTLERYLWVVRLLISFFCVFFKCPECSNYSIFYSKQYRKPPKTPVSDPMDFCPIPILFLFRFSPFPSLLSLSPPALGTDFYILGPLAIWLPVGFGQWEELAGGQWPKERVVALGWLCLLWVHLLLGALPPGARFHWTESHHFLSSSLGQGGNCFSLFFLVSSCPCGFP